MTLMLAAMRGLLRAQEVNPVYNARNLFASSQVLLNDCAIWRHDGDSCSN
jgi:hypothetical protein